MGVVNNKKLGIIESLVRNGAAIDARTPDGSTPLHLAVESEANQALVCELLLGWGADVNAKTVDGASPLHMASKTSN